MKDTEIFYFDVDGTLLNNTHHSFSDLTKKALISLKENGYKVALCTGRSLEGIQDLEIFDLIQWDAYILANGSQILDSSKQVVQEIHFDQDLIHKIDQDLEHPILLEGDITFVTKDPHDKILEAYAHFGVPELPIKSYENEKIFNVLCYDFDQLNSNIQKEILTSCEVFEDQLGNLEIINAKSGKHNGIQFVNTMLNLHHYVGFGDGENDVTFLKHAPISVAMGNGCDNVKAVATHIAPSVDDDGIYKTLKAHNVI